VSFQDIAIYGLLLSGLAAVVLGWVWVANRRIRARLAPIAQALGLALPADGRADPHSAHGEWDGVPVRIRYRVGGRGERDRIELQIEAPRSSPLTVTFSRERAGHRLAKAVGLTREPQSGDRLFDTEVFVECDDSFLRPLPPSSVPSVDNGVDRIHHTKAIERAVTRTSTFILPTAMNTAGISQRPARTWIDLAPGPCCGRSSRRS
jgi:hypothetical protein